MKKAIKVGLITFLLILSVCLSSFLYIFYKLNTRVTPQLSDIKILVQPKVIKLNGSESNLIATSPYLYAYYIKAKSDDEYILIVDQSFGRRSEVNSTFIKIYKTIPVDRQDESVKKLLLAVNDMPVTGKNEIEITIDGQTNRMTVYKLDNGEQVRWVSADSEYYITSFLGEYDFFSNY